MELTQAVLAGLLPPPGKDQAFFRDDVLKGFALRVTAKGAKSFVMEKLIAGKVKRLTLGRFPELTLEQARTTAEAMAGKIAQGINPIAEQKAQRLAQITLQHVYEDYLKARKQLKPKTQYVYGRLMEDVFADLKDKPFLAINKEKVGKLHTAIGEQQGKAYANLAMMLLRALFNFAAGQYEDEQGNSFIKENPVKRLSQTRSWYRIERRKTCIKPHELKEWFNSIHQLANETLRDYFLVILFTGLRRQEAAQLKWAQIDFKSKTLTLGDTKNNNGHVLPLPNYLYHLLQKRHDTKTNAYVFAGRGRAGHIVDTDSAKAKVIAATGIPFTVHDLRRTFATIADSLDISGYALKRLLNHKMKNDVTAGYIVHDVERLRKPMQQITDFLLTHVNGDCNKTF